MKSPFYPTKINGLHRSENSQHINCCLLGKKATLLLKQTSLEGSNLEKKKQKTQKQTNKQKNKQCTLLGPSTQKTLRNIQVELFPKSTEATPKVVFTENIVSEHPPHLNCDDYFIYLK